MVVLRRKNEFGAELGGRFRLTLRPQTISDSVGVIEPYRSRLLLVCECAVSAPGVGSEKLASVGVLRAISETGADMHVLHDLTYSHCCFGLGVRPVEDGTHGGERSARVRRNAE